MVVPNLIRKTEFIILARDYKKVGFDGNYDFYSGDEITRYTFFVDPPQALAVKKQTLIYNGRIGDKINIGYREFSNNVARPAFNNDVEYDLSVSNEIGYKGALIEVIEATNSSITYRLIRNFR